MARIGLVLGGGGIVGMAFHAAVLAALTDATSWDARSAEVVVGTSAGSLTGAELRAGLPAIDLAARRSDDQFTPPTRRLLARRGAPPVVHPERDEVDVDEARRAYRRLAVRAALFPGSVRPGVLLSIAMSPGRLSTRWIAETVQWLHGSERWPEQSLWICSVRLDNGARVVFGRDDMPQAGVGDAVASSCAIPGVNAPVRIGGVSYIDGGAFSPTNLDLVADLGLDLVIVSAPMSAEQGALSDRRDMATRAGCREMLESEAEAVRSRGTRVVVFEPSRRDLEVMGRLIGPDVLDESRCPAIVEQVRASVASRVERGDELPELRGGRSPARVA